MNVAERRYGEQGGEDGYGKGGHERWDSTLSLREGDLRGAHVARIRGSGQRAHGSSDEERAAASRSHCAFKLTIQQRHQRSRELAWTRKVGCVGARDFNQIGAQCLREPFRRAIVQMAAVILAGERAYRNTQSCQLRLARNPRHEHRELVTEEQRPVREHAFPQDGIEAIDHVTASVFPEEQLHCSRQRLLGRGTPCDQ
jgi:hypothetical protein